MLSLHLLHIQKKCLQTVKKMNDNSKMLILSIAWKWKTPSRLKRCLILFFFKSKLLSIWITLLSTLITLLSTLTTPILSQHKWDNSIVTLIICFYFIFKFYCYCFTNIGFVLAWNAMIAWYRSFTQVTFQWDDDVHFVLD
jgi:hypothetical protein